MIFYHYTCLEHLETIVNSGYLKLCQSNVNPPPEEATEDTPQVVWLLKKPLVGKTPDMLVSQGYANVDGRNVPVRIDKSRVEIIVNVPQEDVQRADKFFRKNNTPEWWIKVLENASGGTKVKEWYVVERTVGQEEWVEINDRYNSTDKVKKG